MHPYKTYLFEQIFGNRTLTKFAQDADVSAGNLSRITHGQNASPEVLKKIASASSNNTITSKRLLNLFFNVPKGKITIKEFNVFIEIVGKLVKNTPSDTYSRLISNSDHVGKFCGSTLNNYTLNSKYFIESGNLPTYEDIYCYADIFEIDFQYFLIKDYKPTQTKTEKILNVNLAVGTANAKVICHKDKSVGTSLTSQNYLPDFNNAEEAVKFMLEQPVLMAYGDYNLKRMDNQDIIDMAKDILLAVELSAARQKRKAK